MKKIRFILFLLFAAFFLSLPVYADTLSFDIATSFSDNLLQINGKSAPGDLISVEIVPAESNTAGLWEGISSSRKKKISDSVSVASDAKALTYADFVTADSNGDFSLAASISIDSVISENWEYKILIYSKADKKLYEKNFYFADKETYAILVDEYLNPNVVNKNFDDFKNNITEYRNLMGFNDEKYSDVSYDEIIKQLYNYLLGSGTLLSNDNSGYNDNLYETCAIITALNNGINVYDVSDTAVSSFATDEAFDKYMDQIIQTKQAKDHFTDLMKGKEIKDFDDFADKAVEALILTTVRYPDGWPNIQAVFKEYKTDPLGISSVSSDADVYKELAGKSYASVADLVSAYKKLTALSGSGGSGGTGSGSGSGKNSVNVTGVTGVVSGASETASTLEMPFKDLNSVPWAYSAISNLYTDGVINGVSETKFQPDKSVKREQFIKMIVAAMRLQLEKSGNNFYDVEAGSWYETYIITASNHKLISGMPGNIFGVGYNITRQDMAVMVMNAMISRGYVLRNPALEFADAEQISDYAKSAVAELAYAGIVNGVDDTHFDPKGIATRAQAAVIINRALEYLR